MIDRYKATWNGRTVFLHRCSVCCEAATSDNNGFIPQDEKISHSPHCPEGRPLHIVVPAEEASAEVRRAFSRLADGSVAVAKRRDGGIWIYYEGGIYSRANRPPTEAERLEYAKSAAGRAAECYPTVAFFVLPSMDGLEVIGRVDVNQCPYVVEFDAQ